MMSSNSSIFTDDEQEILNRTKKVRVDIVDNMVKDGVPERVGDIRVLNEILTGLDNMVQTSAANRLKHDENMNNEGTKDTVAEVIRQLATNRNNTPKLTSKPVLENTYIPDDKDVVEGELEITPTALDPKDFMS